MTEKEYPQVICGALIFNSEGKLFLMKSYKWKDKYVIPGGHVELGEKAEDAVKREVKEETNLDVKDIRFVCFQEAIFDDSCWKKAHLVFLDFACKTKSNEVKLNSEGQSFVWITPKEAAHLPVESYTLKAINEYLKLH